MCEGAKTILSTAQRTGSTPATASPELDMVSPDSGSLSPDPGLVQPPRRRAELDMVSPDPVPGIPEGDPRIRSPDPELNLVSPDPVPGSRRRAPSWEWCPRIPACHREGRQLLPGLRAREHRVISAGRGRREQTEAQETHEKASHWRKEGKARSAFGGNQGRDRSAIVVRLAPGAVGEWLTTGTRCFVRQTLSNSHASRYPGAGRPHSLAVTRARATSCLQRKAGRVEVNSSRTVL